MIPSDPMHLYFEHLWERALPDQHATAHLYRHRETGAEVLSLVVPDENKCFGITFRTPPADSTGVAHILEHAVLCGSRKYPLKEPFVELIKGSLHTFINAFTYPDKTCYPVASQNEHDFYNLIDVYLDAVLHPNLTAHTFAQEGWHYELHSPDDPLIYKGVVYNEMKGAYSSPETILGELAQQTLFPDTPYGVDSGGNPVNIPDLTYEQLTQFHASYYHPSNARIWFYGDDDPDTRLRIIHEYLRDFKRIDVQQSALPLQPRFAAPRRTVATYPADPADASGKPPRSYINIGWMLNDTSDPHEVYRCALLGHMLLGTPTAPLRKALTDSGLGEAVMGGYSSTLRQGTFRVYVKGIAFEDADTLEQLTLDTLAQLADNGLDPATIEASLNSIEFSLRENNTGSFPRGLSAMLRALTTWLHDGDPLAMLHYHEIFADIRARLANGERVFEPLIRDLLLNNPHRSTVIIRPNEEQAARTAAAEQERLAAARAALDDAAVQRIIEETATLHRLQETPDPPEALLALPSLTLNDLPTENQTIPCTHYDQQGVRILFHDLPTSGIIYTELGFNMQTLPQELLPYAAVFARVLFELGTATSSDVELTQRIGQTTGGIGTTRFASRITDSDEYAAWLFVRGRVLAEKFPAMLAIVDDVLKTVQLDNRDRVRQVVLKARAGMESGVIPAGHRYMVGRLNSYFDLAEWVEQQMSGLDYLLFLRRLIDEIDHDFASVHAKLVQVRDTLLSRDAMLVNITCDDVEWHAAQPDLDAFLAGLPADPRPLQTWHPTYVTGSEGFAVPATVNYVAKGARLYDLGYQSHGSIGVITNYLRTAWLWEQVRMKGGAYGAFSRFDRHSGVFAFLSYRDPNLLTTLNVYDATARVLRETALDDHEIMRSIIGTIGSIDSYQLPDAKGYTSLVRYLLHDTDELRQHIRSEVLGTTAAHFRAFADVLEQVAAQGRVAVMGSQHALDDVQAQLGLQVTRLL